MASTVAPERLRTRRIPRIDELPQNEFRATDSHPDKRGKTVMQRLASVGLGRSDASNSIEEDTLDISAYLGRRVTTL